MTDQIDDPLFARATLGIEAERFMRSRVGLFIIDRAEQEIERAYQDLAAVDPENSAAIRALQSQIAVARAIPQWLGLAIQDGVQAESLIEEEEAYEG